MSRKDIERDVLSRFRSKILKLNFCQAFETEVLSGLNLGQDFESPSLKLKFGRDFGVKF